jgi:Flp pilus assembly protein TadD
LEAVALDGSLWRAYNGIGVIYDTRSRFGDAAEAYATALTVKPEAAPVLNNFGVSLMQQERFAEAEPRFVRALAIDPEMTRAETNLRMARAMQGKYLEAFAGVSRENMPDALNDVGYAAMLRGDYDLAEAYLSRALEESPVYHKTAAENLESLRRLKEIERAPEGS